MSWWTRSVRGLVAAVVAVTAVGMSAGQAEAVTNLCNAEFGAVGTDSRVGFETIVGNTPSGGSFTVPITRGASAPSVTGGLSSQPYRSYTYWRDLAVRGGVLYSDVTRQPADVGSDQVLPTVSTRVGSGWGGMTRLVDVSVRDSTILRGGYLYGLSPSAGSLSRYAVSEASMGAVRVRSAGSRPGWNGFRALGLAFVLERPGVPTHDVLVATTTRGALYLVDIPRTATFAPRLVPLRNSTWTFDEVVADECAEGPLIHTTLLAVRHSTGQAFMYRLGRVSLDPRTSAGSTIRGLGAVAGGWDSPQASTYADWGFYPARWVKSGSILP